MNLPAEGLDMFQCLLHQRGEHQYPVLHAVNAAGCNTRRSRRQLRSGIYDCTGSGYDEYVVYNTADDTVHGGEIQSRYILTYRYKVIWVNGWKTIAACVLNLRNGASNSAKQ